jgi:hypothetical protein
MVVRLGIGLVVAVAGLLVVVASRPSEYRVARTARIAARPSAVFPHVNDLRMFNSWNPWITLDPGATTTYSGPLSGPGAVMAWAGDKNVGEGRMTIVESRPDELVRFRLDFLKPFAGTADAEFVFIGAGDGTAVTWSMTGHNNLVAKAMHLVIDMDRMIGGRFEKGLASLKSLAEASAKNEVGAR